MCVSSSVQFLNKFRAHRTEVVRALTPCANICTDACLTVWLSPLCVYTAESWRSPDLEIVYGCASRKTSDEQCIPMAVVVVVVVFTPANYRAAVIAPVLRAAPVCSTDMACNCDLSQASNTKSINTQWCCACVFGLVVVGLLKCPTLHRTQTTTTVCVERVCACVQGSTEGGWGAFPNTSQRIFFTLNCNHSIN